MDEVRKVAKINLIILFIYSLIIIVGFRLSSSSTEIAYTILFYMAVAIALQILINLIFAIKIFSKDPEEKKWGKAHLLNSLIILSIGFPTCLAGVSFKF